AHTRGPPTRAVCGRGRLSASLDGGRRLPHQPRNARRERAGKGSSSHAEGVRVIGLPRTPPRQGSHAPNAPRRGLGRRLGRADGVPTRLRRTTAKEDRRSEEHTSELQSQSNLVCRLLLEKKKKQNN